MSNDLLNSTKLTAVRRWAPQPRDASSPAHPETSPALRRKWSSRRCPAPTGPKTGQHAHYFSAYSGSWPLFFRSEKRKKLLGVQYISGKLLGVHYISSKLLGVQYISGKLLGVQYISGKLLGVQYISDKLLGVQYISDKLLGVKYISGKLLGVQYISGKLLRVQYISGKLAIKSTVH